VSETFFGLFSLTHLKFLTFRKVVVPRIKLGVLQLVLFLYSWTV
jgi:hypothetical protein